MFAILKSELDKYVICGFVNSQREFVNCVTNGKTMKHSDNVHILNVIEDCVNIDKIKTDKYYSDGVYLLISNNIIDIYEKITSISSGFIYDTSTISINHKSSYRMIEVINASDKWLTLNNYPDTFNNSLTIIVGDTDSGKTKAVIEMLINMSSTGKYDLQNGLIFSQSATNKFYKYEKYLPTKIINKYDENELKLFVESETKLKNNKFIVIDDDSFDNIDNILVDIIKNSEKCKTKIIIVTKTMFYIVPKLRESIDKIWLFKNNNNDYQNGDIYSLYLRDIFSSYEDFYDYFKRVQHEGALIISMNKNLNGSRVYFKNPAVLPLISDRKNEDFLGFNKFKTMKSL